ncbi:MAG: spermidine synthase family protein [Armatimonadota bacterium]
MAKTKHRSTATQSAPPPTASDPRLRVSLLLAVAVVAAAVLALEITLTRVFAVILRYHFAFLVISIALCGLGIGGFLAHWMRRRAALSLPRLAVWTGAGIVVVLLLILRVVFAYLPNAYWLAALLLLVPFTCAGAFLSELFARYAPWAGRLYAWDLIGAALAAVGVIGLLELVSAIDACLLLAALAVVAGLLAIEPSPSAGRARAGYLAWIAVFLGLFLGNVFAKQKLFEIPPIPPQYDGNRYSLADRGLTQPLFTELGDPSHISRILETRWNAFARTDVVQEGSNDSQYLIYTNGNVPTNMLRWDGDLSRLSRLQAGFPLCDWSFAGAPLGQEGAPRGTVLSIGPGGGLDALLALRHGAADFEGAELNPSIVRLMHDYRDFNGGIYERPEVRVVTAEGRAYVRERAAEGKRYALIFSALTKTATAGQGMSLLESYIHTEDAVADYLKALQDDGQLVLLVDNEMLLARFFVTAASALARQGLSLPDACRRIALAYDVHPGPYQFALLVQKSPITREQSLRMQAVAAERQLEFTWLPFYPGSGQAYQQLADGRETLADFTHSYRNLTGMDVTSCPDNRPFVLDITLGVQPIFSQLAVLAAVLALALVALGWRGGGMGRMTPADGLFVLYFLALGVGFMLVEIPLVQKLILPLGYPTLALAVILFSLLLGGGAGSWFSQRFAGKALRRWAIFATLGVAVLTVAYAPLLGWLHEGLVGVSLPVRCLTAAGLLLPLGFLLGTPFPSGMRLFSGGRAVQVPLVWGLNGVASVVGSLCAAIGAKLFGFNGVLVAGAAVYLLAALLLAAQRPK